MEDDGRLIRILEEQLLGNIDDNGQENKGGEQGPYLGCCRQLGEVLGHGARHLVENTHDGVARIDRKTTRRRGIRDSR